MGWVLLLLTGLGLFDKLDEKTLLVMGLFAIAGAISWRN